MSAKAFHKNIRREIAHSLGRYLAILSIVALGVGFFSGLQITRESMIHTGNVYISESNMYDFKLISTLGLTADDVATLGALDGINSAEGSFTADAFCVVGGRAETVLKIHSLTEKTGTMKPVSGRMPQAANECVLDSRVYSDDFIGQKLVIAHSNSADTLDMFAFDEYTVTGTVRSVNYLNIERGTTKLGGGVISAFAYIPADGFDCEYFTELYLDADIAGEIYSDEYNDGISDLRESVEAALIERGEVRWQGIVDDATAELSDAKDEYNNGLKKYNSEKQKAEDELASALAKITDGQKAINNGRAELAAMADTEKQLTEAIPTLNAAIDALTVQLAVTSEPQTQAALSAQLAELKRQKAEAQSALNTFATTRAELDRLESELKASMAEYESSRAEADGKLADTEAELADAKKEIDDAEAEIAAIAHADTYVLTRAENTGYACFENDSAVVEGIAKVFPLFFFLVAALVCMTTMTRMISEQRTQIGTLKALGYGSSAILWKYVSYSGSSALIGSILGYFAGTRLFPFAIWTAYGILYGFSGISFIFNLNLALISLVVALLCSAGTTLVVCRRELYNMPAELMRPKAPKAGKRILLERLPLIWNHLGFLRKVSLRNIFRYQKRLFMMLLGVGGCTALVLTGFGIRDSISNIAEYQFDEITKYDYTVVFDSPRTPDDEASFREKFNDDIGSVTFVSQTTADADTSAGVKSVNIIASGDENITRFFDLHDNSGKNVPYPGDGEVVLTEKIAAQLNVTPGDSVTLRLGDTGEMTLKLSGICKSYVYNYAYMTASTYEASSGSTADIKYAYASVADGVDLHEAGARLMSGDGVIGVSVTQDLRERVANMMESLNYVVWLVIASAAALAFIVLINLSNINITERQREIATIKVLGFYANETSSYVFRENVILTFLGALVGLPLGVLLHGFVMSQIKIDMVSFDTILLPQSYLFAFALTMTFTFIVDLLMRRKLAVINMAESLKSVE